MSATPITIRRATSADAATIAEFNLAMALETEGRHLDQVIVTRAVARLLAAPIQGVYYVAEQEGRVLGQLLITFEFSDWRDGVFWWIQSVYVAVPARGAGVFRQLHEYVAQAARTTPGVCGLRLYVERRNTRAQEVYRRLGMTQTDYLMFEEDWSDGGSAARGMSAGRRPTDDPRML
jgi:GNAT superfamily N-acetyltransferase